MDPGRQPNLTEPRVPDDPQDSMFGEMPTEWRPPAEPKGPSLATWTVGGADGGAYRPLDRAFFTGGAAFLLKKLISKGGFGEVYEAIQISLDRVVAVKKPQDEHYQRFGPTSEQAVAMEHQFRQEAYLTAQLDHPNIVPVHDLGVDEQGRPLLAMKLVRGRPWSDILREDFENLEVEELLGRHLPILVSMAQAVAFAHSRRIVHRDLKPSQVMIGSFGEVVLMDWGLAVYLGDASGSTAANMPSDMKFPTPVTATAPGGTPCMMSPEQTERSAAHISTRTDIFLLGGTLYFLLTRSYPYPLTNSGEVIRLARQGIVEPPQERAPDRLIPEPLARLAMAALRPRPEDRIATVEEFIEGLQDYLTGASGRRESVAITTELERLLDSDLAATGEDTIYTTLFTVIEQLDRAAGLWMGNRRIAPLRDRALDLYAREALRGDDLKLAGHLAGQIAAPALRSELLDQVRIATRRVARQRRSRRLSVAAVVLLLAALLSLSLMYVYTQGQTNRLLAAERDAAAEAKALAERAQYFSTINFAEAYLRQGEHRRVSETLLAGLPLGLRHIEWGYLIAEAHRESMTLRTVSPPAMLLHAAYDAAGERIVATDSNGHIRLYDAATGALVADRKVADEGIWAAEFSPDGSRIAVSGFDGVARLLDAETLDQIADMLHSAKILRGLAFSPDGSLLAVAGRDDVLGIYDGRTGATIREFDPLGYGVYDVAFSPDGTRLALSARREVAILSTSDFSEILRLPTHPEGVLDIDFSPDGGRLLTACTDRNLRVFDAGNGASLTFIANETSWLQSATFHPRGFLVATGDNDGSIRVWNAHNGARMLNIDSDPRVYKVRFSPDGSQLLATTETAIRLYNIEHLLESPNRLSVPLAETSTGDADAHLTIFSAPLETDSAWLNYDRRWRDEAGQAPGGRTVFRYRERRILADSYYTVYTPSMDRRATIDRQTFAAYVENPLTDERIGPLGDERVYRVAASPDGRLFAAVHFNCQVSVWNSDTLERIALLGEDCGDFDSPSSRFLGDVAFSADSRLLASGDHNGRVALYPVGGGNALWERQVDGDKILAVEVDPTGRSAAAGTLGGRILVLDAEDGRTKASLEGHRSFVMDIQFTPDGERLLSLAHDDTVRVWSIEGARALATLFEEPGEQYLVGFGLSRDGRRAYAARSSQTLLAVDIFPWEDKDLPGMSEGLSLAASLEVHRRQTRLNPAVTPEHLAGFAE